MRMTRQSEQDRDSLPRETVQYLAEFSAKYCCDSVLGYLESAKGLRVLVVGEAIIDEYQYCEAIGKSSKEPTLAVKARSTEKFAGGILAVANHAASFCDKVTMITLLGRRDSQQEFIEAKLASNVKCCFMYKDDSPTIVKRRIVDEYFFTKLLEIYEINDQELTETNSRELCALLVEQVPEHDVVIVVDFGHGMMNRSAIEIVCEKSRFLALNVQANAGNLGYHTVSTYPRADYVAIAEKELRLEARSRNGQLTNMVSDVSRKLDCAKISITQGKNGCLCFDATGGFVKIPAFARQIVDRVGAGDTYLAVSALYVAQGAPIEICGFIGNVAGAQAVATVGHRDRIDRERLVDEIVALMD